MAAIRTSVNSQIKSSSLSLTELKNHLELERIPKLEKEKLSKNVSFTGKLLSK